MRNGAYMLAVGAALGGLLLLLLAGQGDFRAAMGTVLILVAFLLMGLGKGLDLLGHVREGATPPDEQE